jgi:hypothetical protein
MGFPSSGGWAWGLAAVIAATALPASALAQAGAFSPDALSGVLDLRAYAGDGEASWQKGGAGKTRYGGATGLDIGEATLVWHPRFSSEIGAHLQVQYQPRSAPEVGLVEAYLTYRSPPTAELRLSARLGLFIPPVSLEHDDLTWSTVHTITPSVLNTWIAEEVKVSGLEVTARRDLGGLEVSLTGAVFGANDTAGALLAYRGWAAHDVKSTLFSELPLAPFSPARRALFPNQASLSAPGVEVDSRTGYYGRLGWRTSHVAVDLFHYDNAGSRTGLRDGQYAWETRFTDLGVTWDVDGRLRIIAQHLEGETKMGPRAPPIVVDAGYQTTFAMAVRRFDGGEVSGRIETFRIRDRSFQAIDNQDESGSAVTVSLLRDISPRIQGRLELLRVDSDRPMRRDLGFSPHQSQVLGQAALRLSF